MLNCYETEKWCPSESEKSSRRLRPRIAKIYISLGDLQLPSTTYQKFTMFEEILKSNREETTFRCLVIQLFVQ